MLPVGHRSDSLAFVAPLSALAVTGPTLRVFRCPPLMRCASICVLHELGCAFRAPLAAPDQPSLIRLSWDCPRGCLASDIPPARPLHVSPHRSAPRRSAESCHTPRPVPPSWFDHLDGLLRTCVHGCVAIQSRTRFAVFPDHLDGSASKPASPSTPNPTRAASHLRTVRWVHPHSATHPSKNSPRQQPYRITAADALVPLQMRAA